jgi:hypothetical protein
MMRQLHYAYHLSLPTSPVGIFFVGSFVITNPFFYSAAKTTGP